MKEFSKQEAPRTEAIVESSPAFLGMSQPWALPIVKHKAKFIMNYLDHSHYSGVCNIFPKKLVGRFFVTYMKIAEGCSKVLGGISCMLHLQTLC
jgi:hypothetical protein